MLGGILGWLASIVGAFLGGLILAPLFGTGTINQYDFSWDRSSCRSSAR